MLALSFYSLLALLEGLLLSSLKNINPGGLAVIGSLSGRPKKLAFCFDGLQFSFKNDSLVSTVCNFEICVLCERGAHF